MHIAVHYIGCVETTDAGIGVPSRVGPFLDSLGEAVDRVSVVAFDPPGDPRFEDTTEYTTRADNIEVVSLGHKGTRRDWRARRRHVARVIAEASPAWDVLLFYFLPNRRASLVYGPNRSPRIVAFVVGTTATGDSPDTGPARRVVDALTRWWTEYQLRVLLRRAGLVVINSDELRASIGRRRDDALTVVLSARRAHQAYRTSDRLTTSSPKLLVSGRITLEKGVLIALEAFALLKHDLPGAVLHVVGEGDARAAMAERARELGVAEDVVFHGWVPAGDGLFAVYREMDVFLFASYAAYEGFPQVLWETMAHSVLVVCTPVRGTREALEHGRDVLFVPMHDSRAIADAVRKLSSDADLRRSLLVSAYEKASRTSIDDTVAQILDGVRDAWPELRDR